VDGAGFRMREEEERWGGKHTCSHAGNCFFGGFGAQLGDVETVGGSADSCASVCSQHSE
jgi:hypothetical protein